MDFGNSIFYKMLSKHGPFDIVANFAAYKHVRSEKDIFSIESMITSLLDIRLSTINTTPSRNFRPTVVVPLFTDSRAYST